MSYLTRYRNNSIFDVQFDELGDAEPITLIQLKAHLQITYSDDDVYLTDLIAACRAGIEQYCNISLVEKAVTILADLYCEIELPYGPVDTISSAGFKIAANEYIDQVFGTGYEIDGITNGFQLFKPLITGRWKIEYSAGYPEDKLPKDLLLDLKRLCGYCYEHKGDEPLTSLQGGMGRPKGLDDALELFASRHKRLIWV